MIRSRGLLKSRLMDGLNLEESNFVWENTGSSMFGKLSRKRKKRYKKLCRKRMDWKQIDMMVHAAFVTWEECAEWKPPSEECMKRMDERAKSKGIVFGGSALQNNIDWNRMNKIKD